VERSEILSFKSSTAMIDVLLVAMLEIWLVLGKTLDLSGHLCDCKITTSQPKSNDLRIVI